MTLNMKEELGQWYPVLEPVLNSQEGRKLGELLARDEQILRPALPDVFRALRLTQPDNVKVIILGQDPYPGAHADGLAFSSGIDDTPHSLKVIFRHMAEVGYTRTKRGLEDWAEQGVLLLNTALTTTAGKIDAHSKAGWQPVIDAVLNYLVYDRPGLLNTLVMLAWGAPAKTRFRQLRLSPEHLVLESAHPSATRYGYLFKGAEHFKQANAWLQEHGEIPIKWSD